MATNPEKALAEEMAACWADPLRFVRFAFPWGEPGTALEDFDGPDEWQADALDRIGEHFRSGSQTAYRLAVASGHGIGKSALTSWIVLWAMSTRPHMAGVVTANTLPQLQTKTWRQLSIWHKLAIHSHWFKWTGSRFLCRASQEDWYVAATAWSDNNPEAFAGLHADDVLVIYDEASAIADSIWDTSEGAMTTPDGRAMWLVFGNPTRNDGRFARCFGADAHIWDTVQVDARHARQANQAQLQQWIDNYGEDSDFVRVRVRGLFPRISASQLVSPEKVTEGRKRELGEKDYSRYPRLIGVDPARFGDDRSAIICRQGPKAWQPYIHREIDNMELAGHVADLYRRWPAAAVAVDATGMGGGVVDRLRQLDLPVVEVQFASQASDPRSFRNIRAQAWWRLREWVHGECDLPNNDDLEADLLTPEYYYDSQLRLQIEGKDVIRRRGAASPDVAEALVVTMIDDAIQAGMGVAKAKSRRVRRVSAKGWA